MFLGFAEHEGLPIADDRLLRRDAGGLDDWLQPECRADRRDVPGRVCHSRGRGIPSSTPTAAATTCGPNGSASKEHNLTCDPMNVKVRGPDNAAAEGFFSRPRQGSFRRRSFMGITVKGFIEQLVFLVKLVFRFGGGDVLLDSGFLVL